MEALLAFYFGWTMGARSGPKGAEELSQAIATLRQSEEFAAVVALLRKHAATIIRDIAGYVEGADGDKIGVPDVLATVYELIFSSGPKESGEG